MLIRAGLPAAPLLLALAGCDAPADGVDATVAWCSSLTGGVSVGVVVSDALVEASGLVASRAHPGTYWAHNDSGDVARVFAVGADGADLGVFEVTAAAATDWEDLAIAPDGDGWSLLVGDIGDNDRVAPDVVIWRFPEPDPSTPGPTAPAEGLHWTYPDGPHDAEALLVDPRTGDAFVLTKDEDGTRAYRATAPLHDGAVLEDVGRLPLDDVDPVDAGATAADVTVDGDRILVRSYAHAWLFERGVDQTVADALGATPCRVPLADDGTNGEAIAWEPAGHAYLTVREGLHPTLWRFAPI